MVTRTVPIVFAQVADPVGSGHVASLARPGGNITGFALYEPAIAVKWLELLKEIRTERCSGCRHLRPTDFNSKHMQEIEAVIASFGVQLSSFIIPRASRTSSAPSTDFRYSATRRIDHLAGFHSPWSIAISIISSAILHALPTLMRIATTLRPAASRLLRR